MTQSTPSGAGDTAHPDPYEDVPSWWSYFFAGGYSWRWFSSPHLYFPAGLEYAPGPNPFTVVDGMGREKTYDKPFECYLDPATGKIKKLIVQAPRSICKLSATEPNATWARTPIRNATHTWVRLANLPFRFVPLKHMGDVSDFEPQDWISVILMWIPTVAVFLFAWIAMIVAPGADVGKDSSKYLPLLYQGLRYPRLARNILENRKPVVQRLRSYASWNTKAALSTYRTFRPRFLNYLVEAEREDGRKTIQCERRPVGPNDLTPFVLVAYSSEQYSIPDESRIGEGADQGDLEALLAFATKAAIAHFKPVAADLQQKPCAFWVAVNCMPPSEVADNQGNIRRVTGLEKEMLANSDTYSISDIIRAAQHVIVIAGNIRHPWDDGALRVWGKRVWTLPEILLSKGDSVTVYHCGYKAKEYTERNEIHKAQFPTVAWPDPLNSRQLLEHFSSLHLSRLELVKITLECLMSRRFNARYPGDRAYVLMGLLRVRPPIDSTDSAFQAFARLSLPQDSDRLMERLICLLPDTPDQNWELMRDQYKASLWDIYPDTQVCAIGENDTIVLDGAKGALIKWSNFTKLRSFRRLTVTRALALYSLAFSPLIFFLGILLTAVGKSIQAPGGISWFEDIQPTMNPALQTGIAFLVISLALILPAPYFLWNLFAGKLWAVEPCFFGIEGYVPLDIIEANLFGIQPSQRRRLRWSGWGSPLSRHEEGPPMHERNIQYNYRDTDASNTTTPHSDPESEPLVQPHPPHPSPADVHSVSSLPTYPIRTVDPTSPCSHCSQGQGRPAKPHCAHHPTVSSLQALSRSAMGHAKVFTLVDTLSLTATLFYAARPPTVLVVGGSEGGMKRALACSFDVATGTLCRETVLRVPSRSVDCMEQLPRVRLGLRRGFLEGDVRKVPKQQQGAGVAGYGQEEGNVLSYAGEHQGGGDANRGQQPQGNGKGGGYLDVQIA